MQLLGLAKKKNPKEKKEKLQNGNIYIYIYKIQNADF